jgi:hypothetical protein
MIFFEELTAFFEAGCKDTYVLITSQFFSAFTSPFLKKLTAPNLLISKNFSRFFSGVAKLSGITFTTKKICSYHPIFFCLPAPTTSPLFRDGLQKYKPSTSHTKKVSRIPAP